ncbi:MAG TPA: Stp1/IreP family PP2C-type Ser/Thr phosphatase [Clostridiales bacterium]|jgi:protein phosphatase|nr:Stp1/IreP family PP2C-type Ser/Thr phosphatase [Clostridiales bacterium]HCS10175.1 Stp1/IreP family PP2C-type Ser/Thr phosphatase [Clostridiales bacterium]
MNVFFETNKGLMRENNEDSLIVKEFDNYCLYAVADGMGGHNAGEVASSIAIEEIRNFFDESMKKGNFKPPLFIIESVNLSNDKIREESFNKEGCCGMGTTITMAVIDKLNKIIYIGNIGDSRAYLLRNNELKQITTDHTYVNELMKDGKITAQEAKTHPKRNVITRALGSEEFVHADIFEMELFENDILLLCTDGLTTHVSDDNMLEIIKEYGASESVQKLIKQANDNGGTDNITIIIVDNIIRGETYDR